MKTILVISDQSSEAEHAALFALKLACMVQADVIFATTVKAKPLSKKVAAIAGITEEEPESTYAARLNNFGMVPGSYIPAVTEMDVSDYPLDDLIAFINRQQIWLVVEGLPDKPPVVATGSPINAQSVLNRVRCPLLLVPAGWPIKSPERIAYLADLRYCRRFVLHFLDELSGAVNAALTVAHLSAKGLPDIAGSYSAEIFSDDIVPYIHHAQVFLSNIRERDLHKAVDVLLYGMQQDMLVLVNHKYHFEELIGRRIGSNLPADITVPVLVFPL